MGTRKTFRHGQILRLVTDGSIVNQEDLRRRLAAQRLRVTQATLSRDIQELRLIKTHARIQIGFDRGRKMRRRCRRWRAHWANFCWTSARRKIFWC